MSIKTLNGSNIRIVELGKGTTGISQVHIKGDSMSSGIAFSDTIDGNMSDNGVIIEILNEQGVYSYLIAIFELVKTWQTDDNIKSELNKVTDDLIKQINKLNLELNS